MVVDGALEGSGHSGSTPLTSTTSDGATAPLRFAGLWIAAPMAADQPEVGHARNARAHWQPVKPGNISFFASLLRSPLRPFATGMLRRRSSSVASALAADILSGHWHRAPSGTLSGGQTMRAPNPCMRLRSDAHCPVSRADRLGRASESDASPGSAHEHTATAIPAAVRQTPSIPPRFLGYMVACATGNTFHAVLAQLGQEHLPSKQGVASPHLACRSILFRGS